MKSVDYKGDGMISRLRFCIITEASYECGGSSGSGVHRAGQKVDPKPKYVLRINDCLMLRRCCTSLVSCITSPAQKQHHYFLPRAIPVRTD